MLHTIAGHGGAGPVHEPQIDVVGAQVLEAVVNGLGDALVVRVVQLGRQPDLVARHTGGLDAGADFLFVAVGGGGVDVTVAAAEGGLNGGLDLVGLGLPCSEADGGDLVACVEREGATVFVSASANTKETRGNGELGGRKRCICWVRRCGCGVY